MDNTGRVKNYGEIDWQELFYYDETSPSSMRWRVDRFNCSNTLKAAKGDIAGSKTTHGYWVVPHKGKYYKSHRIVWLLTGGQLAVNEQIDHIDRDRLNNKIHNLRKVSSTENRRNISKQDNNTSGVTGVQWRECCTKKGHSSTYAISKWNEESGAKVKYFSVKKYGLLPAFVMASAHRDGKLREMNLAGYGYSKNHGK